ncbi:PAS domain S-box protein [Halorientalis brevis]|uniref:PAS domain S-box protein n=1 Tax=Halorientalis brevis TaxID=1126241 RepID=A0ABD6C8H9_9EURY
MDDGWCSGLANAIRDGVYRLDGDRHVTAVNDALVEVTGYSRRELLGEHVSVLFEPDAFARAELAIRRLLSGDDRGVEAIDVQVTTATDDAVPCTLRVGTADSEDGGATIGVLRPNQPTAPTGSDFKSSSPREASVGSFEESLSRALRRICRETRWVYGDAWMPTASGELALVSSADVRDADAEFAAASSATTFEPGEGLVGRVYESGEAEWIRDVTDADAQFHRAAAARESGLTTALGVPVVADAGVIAVLTFLLPAHEAVDEQMIDLLTTMVDQLGEVLQELHAGYTRWQHDEQFQQMVDAIEDYAIFMLDPAGRVVTWNEGAKRLKGYERDQVVGEHIATFYTEEDREAGRPDQNLADAASEGRLETEGWRVRSDGSRFWAKVTITAVRDDDGTLQGYTKVTRDMTERREYEQQLQHERDTLESEMTDVFERVTDAFFGLDDDWQFTYVNAQAEQLLDASKSELLGATIWDVFPETVGSTFQEQFERAMVAQEPVSFEQYLAPLDTWFAINAYPSESGLSVYFRDVTDRKERATEVRQQRNRAQTILELAGSVMVIIDPDGTVSYVNQRGCELLGYEKDELLGADWFETCIPARHRDDVRDVFENVLAGSDEADTRVGTVVTADGNERLIKWNNTVLRADGDASVLSAGTDITERIHREERLQRYSDYLNQFYHTSTRADVDFEEKVERLLASGREFLDFDVGILSEIDGDDYHVRHVSDETGNIGVGDTYSLADTYCEVTLQQTQPLGFASASDADLTSHPCYREFELESYLGVPVHVNGELYGTLSFASPDPRDREITELDRTVMTLLSQWIGYELGRKQRERELEEYEQVMETIDDGVYVIDEASEFVFVNEAYAEMTGYTRAELIGAPAARVVGQETADRVEDAYETVRTSDQETLTVEGPMQRADGTEFMAEGTLSVMELDDGRVGRVGVVRDITERKEFEETVQALHSTTRDLYEATSDEAVSERIVDAATEVLDLSGVAVYLYDRERDELYPAAVSSEAAFMRGQSLPRVPPDESSLTGHVYASGESVRLADVRNSPHLNADETDMRAGVFVPLGDHGIAIVGSREVDAFDTETEQLVELLATNAESALDRLDRERELKESQRRLRTLVDNFPNGGVTLFDEELRYLVLGGEMPTDVGRTASELEGRLMDEVLPESLSEELRPLFETALDGEASTVELEVGDQIRKLHTVPVRDDDGAVIAGLAMSQDVTELRQRESELQGRVRQQQVVTQLGQRALAADDLDDLFDEAVEFVAETLDNDYCKVLELEPDSDRLLLRSGVGWRDGLVGSARVPTDRQSQAGYTLASEEPVVVPDMDAETRFSGPELLTSHDVASGISVVIGPPEEPWGVLGIHDTEKRAISDQDVNFVQSVANILTTAIDRIEHEQQIERQRERLAALNNLNGIIRDIISVLIQQSTREDIEELVCERLADSDSYAFAWTGDVDTNTDEVVVRAEAGVEGYLEDITITVDDSSDSQGPTGRAIKAGEVQVCQDVTEDPAYEQWRDRALEHGYRSSVAIPIIYENTTYGVLNVYAKRPYAFSGEERAVVEQLGEVMGHAINAIERKRLLMSDEVVEVEFRIRDMFEELGLEGTPEGKFSIAQTIPTSRGYLAYGTASADGAETLKRLVEQLSAWADVSFISEEAEGTRRFELKLAEPPALSIITAHGGHIPSATFADGDYRMTAELPPNAPVREVVETVKNAYPATELLAQRRTAADREIVSRHQFDLADLLTERQFAALEAAYFAGFFEWPRESTGEDVADALDISAPTFHQHLRGAERRLLNTIIEGDTTA